MEIRPIKNDQDHAAALAEIDRLWDADLGTPEADRLDILTTLVVAYEETNHSIAATDPVDAILFRMEQMELTRHDLEPYIGSRGRVSEILNRTRNLSLAMIRRLNKGLGIPAEVLIQPSCPGST